MYHVVRFFERIVRKRYLKAWEANTDSTKIHRLSMALEGLVLAKMYLK